MVAFFKNSGHKITLKELLLERIEKERKKKRIDAPIPRHRNSINELFVEIGPFSSFVFVLMF
jgi:hypothetical protein